MYNQPSSHIPNPNPKSPNDFAFQRQEYLSPFQDRSEDHNSIRDTDSYHNQNAGNNFSDGSNNSRYAKHPKNKWNNNLEAPTKRVRDGEGFRGMDNDTVPYQCIDYGHGKLAPSRHDINADQPPMKAHQRLELELEAKDSPDSSIGIVDEELFQLFEDGLNLMIKTDQDIWTILEFDSRLEWALSPIFKDRDLEMVTQRLGEGKEAVAAKKLERMVWLTKKKIRYLYKEIVQDVSSRRKNTKKNKRFTAPLQPLIRPRNQRSHREEDLKFAGSPSNAPMSPYTKLPPDAPVPIPLSSVRLPLFPLGPPPPMQMASLPYGSRLMPPFMPLTPDVYPPIPINPLRFPLIPVGPNPTTLKTPLLHTPYNDDIRKPPQVTPAVAKKKDRKGRPCLRQIPLEPPKNKKK